MPALDEFHASVRQTLEKTDGLLRTTLFNCFSGNELFPSI